MANEGKFWTLQKKIYAVAGTIVLVGSSMVALNAGGKCLNDSIDRRINVRAERVADSCDSIIGVKRYPIDSMILAKLDRIGTDIKRTTYFQEQGMTDADISKARALWIRDSIRWARDER